MIQILIDNLLYIIGIVFVLVIGGFIALCIKIRLTDLRSRRRSQQKPVSKARMTLYREDGTAVDMTPYIRDISFGRESPEPPDWARRIADLPDASVTIEMEAIVTEEDHGTSHDGGDPRTERADQP